MILLVRWLRVVPPLTARPARGSPVQVPSEPDEPARVGAAVSRPLSSRDQRTDPTPSDGSVERPGSEADTAAHRHAWEGSTGRRTDVPDVRSVTGFMFYFQISLSPIGCDGFRTVKRCFGLRKPIFSLSLFIPLYNIIVRRLAGKAQQAM